MKKDNVFIIKVILLAVLGIITLFFLGFITYYTHFLLNGGGEAKPYATDVVKETIRGGREFLTGLGTTIIGYVIGRGEANIIEKKEQKNT